MTIDARNLLATQTQSGARLMHPRAEAEAQPGCLRKDEEHERSLLVDARLPMPGGCRRASSGPRHLLWRGDANLARLNRDPLRAACGALGL